eukprot:9195144-Alexandrium_andersonii.AAC.1
MPAYYNAHTAHTKPQPKHTLQSTSPPNTTLKPTKAHRNFNRPRASSANAATTLDHASNTTSKPQTTAH